MMGKQGGGVRWRGRIRNKIVREVGGHNLTELERKQLQSFAVYRDWIPRKELELKGKRLWLNLEQDGCATY
jgi:hypothetical protein